MKIAQIISAIDTGGAEKQLLWLCQGLQRQDWDVVVASIQLSNDPMRNEFVKNGFAVKEFDLSGSFNPAVFLQIVKWLRQEAPEIVHTHLFKADIYGGLAAHFLKIPVICTKANEDQYLNNPIFAYMARSIAAKCTRVVAVSEAVQKWHIRVAKFQNSWFEKISIGIPLNRSAMTSKPSEVVQFGVVARLVRQKGHSVLFQALSEAKSKLPPFVLLVFGTGPLESELKKEVAELGLQQQVKFCGFVGNTVEIFSALDVMILPSIWEGAGLVLLESMLYGVPIVASNIGGIPEYLHQECGLLIPGANVAALAEALVKIGTNPQLRKNFSARCREQVKLFDFEKTLSSHLSIYQEAVRR